ncbi:MAG: glycosyltransferase family 4 protein [Endomicrobia bacterium]|nr:glycosyltransferase family 4 protein [Candidatus Aenigmarchaeota archaeon]MCX7911198.1 glycosyltransferase family 4 protein [Endomicrobiia bacterium]MDW8149684.1 glycosyltransferase family 4 protein [Candidatus Aenigmarchaeota archaeon]
MRVIKILVIHEIFFPDFSGGGERILLEIIKCLSKFFKVDVLTSGNPKIKRYKNIRTYRVNVNRFLFNLFSLPYVIAIGKKYDVLLANTYHSAIPSFIAARILKKPIILLVHGAYNWKWFSINMFLGLFALFLEKVIFSLPFDRFIFFSEFAKKEGQRLGAKRCVVLYPGVKITREAKNIKKKKIVLFVGRIERQKGIDRLIKVAKMLPTVKFVVIGRGRIKEKLKNITYLGFVSDNILRRYYRDALIFFLPSRAETLGYSILEAMANGCIIVSTVDLNYVGFYLKKFDANHAKEIIKEIINNNKKYERLGKDNIEIVKKKYRWNTFTKNFLEILENLN